MSYANDVDLDQIDPEGALNAKIMPKTKISIE